MTDVSVVRIATNSREWIAELGEARGARGLDLHLLPVHTAVPPHIANESGYSVIFDGAIFNSDEIRSICNVRDESAGNAQLVLKAYLHYGEQIVHKLRGRFAVLIWDVREQKLICARDAVGTYPLFYARVGRSLLFSTSIQSLLADPRVPNSLNREQLADHLRNRWPRSHETYFSSINRVSPGHVMVVHGGSSRQTRYWNPAPLGHPTNKTGNWVTEEDLGQFDTLFNQAVERCMGNSKTGIFLSGGFDSVSIAAVASDIAHQRLLPTPSAFSLLFPTPQSLEETVQRTVATDLRLPQVLVPLLDTVDPDTFMLRSVELSREFSSPILNLWMPGYDYLAAQAELQSCDTILTGSGGDEWLAVNTLLAADLIRALDVRGLQQLYASHLRSYHAPAYRQAYYVFWKYGARPLAGAVARRIVGQAMPGLVDKRLHTWASAKLQDWMAPDSVLRREIVRRNEERPHVIQSGESFYLHDLIYELNLPVASMEMEEAFQQQQRRGLRVLSPYWDSELVEFLCRVPPHLLNRGGRAKGLVRHMLAERFPELGFERHKKVGADTAFNDMVQRESMQTWEALGGTTALADLGVVDTARLEMTFKETLARGHILNYYNLWNVLNLESWARHYA